MTRWKSERCWLSGNYHPTTQTTRTRGDQSTTTTCGQACKVERTLAFVSFFVGTNSPFRIGFLTRQGRNTPCSSCYHCETTILISTQQLWVASVVSRHRCGFSASVCLSTQFWTGFQHDKEETCLPHYAVTLSSPNHEICPPLRHGYTTMVATETRQNVGWHSTPPPSTSFCVGHRRGGNGRESRTVRVYLVGPPLYLFLYSFHLCRYDATNDRGSLALFFAESREFQVSRVLYLMHF